MNSRIEKSVVLFVAGNAYADGLVDLCRVQAYVLDQRRLLEFRSYCLRVVDGQILCDQDQDQGKHRHTFRYAGVTLPVHAQTGQPLRRLGSLWLAEGQAVSDCDIRRVFYSTSEVAKLLEQRSSGQSVEVPYDLDRIYSQLCRGRIICRDHQAVAQFAESALAILKDGSWPVATALKPPTMWVQFPQESQAPEPWIRNLVMRRLRGEGFLLRILKDQKELDQDYEHVHDYADAAAMLGPALLEQLRQALIAEFSHSDSYGLMVAAETVGSIPSWAHVYVDATCLPEMQLVSRHCLIGNQGVMSWNLEASSCRRDKSARPTPAMLQPEQPVEAVQEAAMVA